jgi:ABC-type antimicrobial peptide transport system permease subunit
MDFLMNYKTMKNGFKLGIIALTILSIVGCSTSNRAYTYKEELKEYKSSKKLPAGVLAVKSKDGSSIQMIVNDYNQVTLITKESILYDEAECRTKLADDYKSVRKSLYWNGGHFEKSNEDVFVNEYSYAENREFKIVVKNCYKNIDNDKYQYNIQVKPNNPSEKTTNNLVSSVLGVLGGIVAAPFILVAAVIVGVIVTPVFIYFMVKAAVSK